MYIRIIHPSGEISGMGFSAPKGSKFTVVIQEGDDCHVEGAFTAQQSVAAKAVNESNSKSEPNIAVRCGDGEGDLGGLGRIGGVGERKDREDKGERQGEEECTPAATIGRLEFPLKNGKMWCAGEVLARNLILAYGAATTLKCFTRARAWLHCNPDKLKTEMGMPRFLNRWLSSDDRPVQQPNNSLTKDVRTTAKIVKGKPTVEGW